ncbi:MAG: HAMP domain-containing protein, partial [Gammaproteobacteria bacterium]
MKIRLKLLLPSLVAFISFLLLLLLHWLPIQLDQAKQDFIHNQQKILTAMESDIVRHVLAHDFAALYGSVDYQMELQVDAWTSLTLTSNDGRMLYPLFSPEQAPVETEFLIRIDHPIQLAGKTLVDATLYADWTAPYQSANNAAYELLYTLSGLFLVFMLLGYFIQDGLFRRPLLQLTESAGKIAGGNYEVTLPKASKDEIGELTTTFATMRDNLEHNRQELREAIYDAETKETYQRSVFESMAEGLITLDEKGTILSANAAVVDIFDHDRDKLPGSHISTLIPSDLVDNDITLPWA